MPGSPINDAWVWLTVLVPKELGPYTAPDNLSASNNVVHWNYPKENAENIAVQFEKVPVSLDPDGDGTDSEYYRTSLLYKKVLSPEAATGIMLSTVYMDTHIDIAPNGDWYWVKDGNTTKLDWNSNTSGLPKLYVSAYAIQAENFADVNAAYAAYQTQWGDNGDEYNSSVTVVTTTEEMFDAVNAEGAVIMGKSYETANASKSFSAYRQYAVKNGQEVTVDLNGKTIDHNTSYSAGAGYTYLYTVAYNSTLTLDGDGTINSVNPGMTDTQDNAILYVQSTGKAIINNGNFNVEDGIAARAGSGAHIVINGGNFTGGGKADSELIYALSSGVIDIYGGFFHNKTHPESTLNTSGSGGAINVYGGTFVNYDPTDPDREDPGSIRVADGYTVVSETQANGDVWYTVEEMKPVEVAVSADNIAAVDFTQDNAVYSFSGTFTADMTIDVTSGLTQTFDGTDAVFNGNVVLDQGIAHSASSLDAERSGNLTVKGFEADTLSVNAINMESVNITGNTVHALSVAGGNLELVIDGNNIDGNEGQYATGNTEHNTVDYGITLRITDYELSITDNVITDTYSHAIGINGRQDEENTVGWIDRGANNVIKAFSGNKITVNSTKKTGRAALKIWNDKAYAPYATSGQQPNAKATALMASITADSTNVFTLGEGHTTFNIYDYKQ